MTAPTGSRRRSARPLPGSVPLSPPVGGRPAAPTLTVCAWLVAVALPAVGSETCTMLRADVTLALKALAPLVVQVTEKVGSGTAVAVDTGREMFATVWAPAGVAVQPAGTSTRSWR